MTPDTSSQQPRTTLSVFVDGEIQCERCGERERQGMSRCERSDCPYLRRKSPASSYGAIGRIFIGAMSMIFVLFGVVLLIVGNSLEGLGGTFLILAVLALFLYLRFPKRDTLFNPTTGVTSHREALFGREIRRKVILPTEKLRFPSSPFVVEPYPASAAILRFKMQGLFRKQLRAEVSPQFAAEMYVVAIADLAARGVVEVWRASAITTGLFSSQRTDYVVLRGKQAEQKLMSGSLEQSLMSIVIHWPENLVMYEGANAYMLVYQMFTHPVNNPQRELIKIGEASHHQYIGDKNAGASLSKAKRWYEQILSAHPDFVQTITKQVQSALSARTASSD